MVEEAKRALGVPQERASAFAELFEAFKAKLGKDPSSLMSWKEEMLGVCVGDRHPVSLGGRPA